MYVFGVELEWAELPLVLMKIIENPAFGGLGEDIWCCSQRQLSVLNSSLQESQYVLGLGCEYKYREDNDVA